MENGTTKKTVEMVDFNCPLFPAISGKRIESAKYSKEFDGKKVKVVLTVPVPATDEDCQTMFNQNLSDLVALGARQSIYGERFCTEFLAEKQDLTDDDLETIRKEVEEALFKTEKAATTTKSAAKIGKAAKASGLEAEDFEDKDLQAMIAKYKAKKAKATQTEAPTEA